jgi:hypothetical protein
LYGGRYGSHVFDLYELPASAAKLIEITEKGSESNFDIQQILLYIFDDIALVTIQLCATSPLKWETALNVISYLRNVYFQHYEPRTNDAPSGPATVWKGGGGIERVRILPLQAPQPDPPVDRGDEMRCAIESPPKFGQLQPKIHRHWRDLLAPLTNGEIQIRLLGDHRMAVMVFLGMEDVTSISDDAWFALTQADGANFPRYAPAFRGRELALTAYDRWWDPSSANPDALKHRYLAGPMTYCCVLQVPPEHRPVYIDRIRVSWRRQHYQIFLLAYYQRAALLVLQDRIANAAARIGGRESKALADDIEGIERDMARFSSGRWFTEISPQIQGQELYELVATQLHLGAHYDGVIHDKALLGNWMAAREERRREKMRDGINWFLIPIGLTAAILNGQVFVRLLKDWIALCPVLTPVGVDAVTFFIVLAFVYLVWLAFHKLLRGDS